MTRASTLLRDDWTCTRGPTPEAEAFAVSLPHDGAVSVPRTPDAAHGDSQGHRDGRGVLWYRRTHVLDSDQAGRRHLLEIDGIHENSTIWVNGHAAGGRGYGYSPFTLDITRWVLPGLPRATDHRVLLGVRAVDEDGTTCSLRTDVVEFSSLGDLEILGVDNGDLRALRTAGVRRTCLFEGGASALVRPRPGQGTATLLARSPGLEEARIDIELVD